MEYIAWRLEELGDLERAKIMDMPSSKVKAQMADFIATKMRIPLPEAIATVKGTDHAESIRKAVTRLRSSRNISKRRK
jgi:hypothetical protein